MKSFLLLFWNVFWDIVIWINDSAHYLFDSIYSKIVKAPNIATIEESIRYIIDNKCSVSRYGDGEIKLVAGKDLEFQHCTPEIKSELIKVLTSPIENHIVCLQNELISWEDNTVAAQKHWRKHFAYYRRFWYKYIDKSRQYFSTSITRPYIIFKDKSPAVNRFKMLQQIWEGKDILLVEGRQSRLGVGNDLFNNAQSIKRILLPNKEAYKHIDRIVEEVMNYAPHHLVLLALGPTATVLAYRLSICGYQAIDIGHVDIEYEWMKMGVDHKVPVKNKYVNEAGGGSGVGESSDRRYLAQIVNEIL